MYGSFKQKKIYLGGVSLPIWRDRITNLLVIDYSDDIGLDDFDYYLYVIMPTDNIEYTIAELIDSSNKRPEKTLFVWYKHTDLFNLKNTLYFNTKSMRAIEKVKALACKNGAKYFDTVESVAYNVNTNL